MLNGTFAPNDPGESQLQLHEGRHSFKTFLEAADIRDSRIDRYLCHANHGVQGR
jgi:hypothetical protein